jgi:hypothetical protein
MIDIERLGVLLDKGDAMAAASQQSRTALMEKEATLREARVDLEQAEAAVARYRGPKSGLASLTASVDAKRTKCKALDASIGRQRTAQTALARRVQPWLTYCHALRTLAKKHGVEL